MDDALRYARFAQQFLVPYQDLIETVVYVGLFLWACKLFHIDLATYPIALLHEFRDLLNAKPTTGAINGAALVIMFAIFLVLVFSEKIAALFSMLSLLFGETKVKELLAGAIPLFALAFVVFSVFSVYTVARIEADSKRGRKTAKHN